MDVTGTMAMARALGKHGALTALHKHYPEGELAEFFAGPDGAHAFYSLGTTAADLKKLAAVAKAAPIRLICLDVANGYAEKFLDVVKRVRDDHPEAVIMAGNVVTGDMTEALIIAGADIVKIGIGPGSVCTTRRVTGVGYPAAFRDHRMRRRRARPQGARLRRRRLHGSRRRRQGLRRGGGFRHARRHARRPRRMRRRDPLRDPRRREGRRSA